jgi:hypothetical protein
MLFEIEISEKKEEVRGWKCFREEGLHNMCSSQGVITVIKSSRM